MKKFIIRAGFSFVMPDSTVKVGGDTIDLEDDVAQQHLHKLEAQPEPEPKKAKKPAAVQGTSHETPDPAGSAGAADPGAADPAAGAAAGDGATTDPA